MTGLEDRSQAHRDSHMAEAGDSRRGGRADPSNAGDGFHLGRVVVGAAGSPNGLAVAAVGSPSGRVAEVASDSPSGPLPAVGAAMGSPGGQEVAMAAPGGGAVRGC
jgi:hypothetical protein